MANERHIASEPKCEIAGQPLLERRQMMAAIAGAGLTLSGCFGARTGLLVPDLSRLVFIGNASATDFRGILRLLYVGQPGRIADLTRASDSADWPAWSPDARRLAYAREEIGRRFLIVRDLGLGRTDPERRIARLEWNSTFTPTSWGPTGLIAVQQRSHLLGGTSGTPFSAIFTVPAMSSGLTALSRITPTAINASYPTWTDDGAIVFVNRTGGEPALGLIEPDLTTVRPLGIAGDEPDVLGDRRSDVLYVRGENIYRNSLVGGSERLVVEGGRTPRFGPSGNELAFAKDGRIWVSDGAGGGAHPITEGPEDRRPAWSLYVTDD